MSTRPPSSAAKSPFRRPQIPRNLTEEQRSEERTSTWLELFFDLCFVVAVAALARGLHDDPTLGGALRFAGLFVPVWWSWMIFTWYATSFDNDDVPYRVTFLAAMLCMLGLAASVEGVGTEAGAMAGFVLAYAVMRLLLVGLWVRARYHTPPALRGFASWYAAGNALGAVLWVASLALPAPMIYGAWAVALFVELLAPILAVRTLEDPRVSFHPRHIPERYGLFTIIVLGESVLAVVAGTAGTDWASAAVLTGVFGFVAAACIWWLYFDHVGSAGLELGPRTAFYWGYGHLAVYAGIAAFGVGVQLAVEGAATVGELASVAAAPPIGEGGVVSGAREIFGGSVALYLAAIGFIHWVNEHTLDDRIILVRLIAAVAAVGLAFFGSALSPPLFAASIALLLLALTAFETLRAGETSP